MTPSRRSWLGLVVAALAMLTGCGGGDGHSHKDHDHDHKDHGHKDHGHDHDHDHSGPNAHLWLDPVRTKLFVQNVSPRLTEIIDAAAKKDAKRKPVIVASIFPIGSLIEGIVGDSAEVKVMLPTGGSPHGFDLTPAVLRMVSEADALVFVGLSLDPWAEKAAKNARKEKAVLRFAELLKSSESDEEEFVPGRLDPPLPPLVVRRQALIAKLDALHKRCEAELSKVKTKELVTFHNAFDLLAERYGLKVVAHLTEMDLPTGAEVTPGALTEARAAVKKHGLKVLYAEPQYPDSALRAIQEATGVTILKLDDLGGPDRPGYRTYFEMMESNLKTLMAGQSR